jgi:transposase-like protein
MSSKKRAGSQSQPRWSESEAEEILALLDESGQSVAAFAREQGLTPQRLYWWRNRLGRGSPAETDVDLVPVQITDGARVASEAVVVVRLMSGIVLEVPPAASPRWAAALVRALDEV